MIMRTLLPLCVLLLACTGTDVGNPPRGGLAPDSTKGVEPISAWQPDPAVYSGLSCLLWERDGGMLRVRVTNLQTGCEVHRVWKPRAVLSGDKLDLFLDNPECIVAGCGSCIYDLAFDVELGDAQQEAPELLLRLLDSDCGSAGERNVFYKLSLPIGAQQRGASCDYTFSTSSAFSAFIFKLARPDSPRVPCGVWGTADRSTCQTGACTDVDPSSQLCLPTCSSDAECAPSDVTACVAGVCQLRAAQ
jgi:hypothetical protein